MKDKSELTHRELLGTFFDKVKKQGGPKSQDVITQMFVEFEPGLVDYAEKI